MTLPVWAPLAVLIVLCGLAAWLDITRRQIPNWLCATTAVAGLAAALAMGGLSGLGSHALHAFLALLGGMVLFALGGFGGGDAKFYAGVASWFALGQAFVLLLSVTLSGLLVLMGWFVYRRVRRIPIRRQNRSPFVQIPYGIGIALGGLIAATV